MILPPGDRQRARELSLARLASFRDPMEAVGVPHPEVGCIVGNGCNRRRGDLAGVAVYSVFGWLAGVTNHEGM